MVSPLTKNFGPYGRRLLRIHLARTSGLLVLAGGVSLGVIPVSEPAPTQRVDFAADVAPFLSDNCVSCHSKTTRKGGLNLENPAAILKGGESGPAAIPGKASESLLLKVSTHEDPDSAMPPRDNKVKAKNLTSVQLGLLKRWIDQGAQGSSSGTAELKWKALPPHLRSILAVAVSADGELAACAKANQILIYRLPTAQLLFRTEAHRDQVQSLAFSPDGSKLASGGFREVKVWERTRQHPRQVTQAPEGLSAVSSDGAWLATATPAGISILSISNPQEPAKSIEAQGAIRAIAWTDDSRRIAILTQERRVAVWDRVEARMVASFEMAVDDALVAWKSDGTSLWTGGASSVVREWEIASFRLVREIKWQSAKVTALVARGPRLLIGAEDGVVCVGGSDESQPSLRIKSPAPVVAADLTLDGSRIAVAGQDLTTRVFDAKGNALWNAKGDSVLEERWEDAQRHLDLEEVALGYWKESMAEAEKASQAAKDRLKKATDLVPVRSKDWEAKQKADQEAAIQLQQASERLAKSEAAVKKGAENGPVASAVATVNAGTAKASEALDEEVKKAKEAVEAAQKKKTTAADELQKALKAKDTAELEAKLSAQEDIKTRAETDSTKQALADQEKRKSEKSLAVEAAKKAFDSAPGVTSIRLMEAQRALLIGQSTGRIQVRGIEAGLLWSSFGEAVVGENPVQSFAVSRSKVVAQVRSGKVWSWSMEESWRAALTLGDGRKPEPFQDRVLALAFSPDGQQLATGGGDPSRDGDVLVFSMKDWKAAPKKAESIHSDTVLGLAFSPDGRQLVSGAADKTARIINLEQMKMVRTLEGHTHHVLGVAWSPDGRTIVTAGADNTVKIWDAATGSRKKSVDGVEKEVTAVQFLGGGSQFISASGDGKLRLISVTGAVAKVLPDAATFVQSFGVSPRGSAVVAGGEDGWLRIWNTKLAVKIAEMEAGP